MRAVLCAALAATLAACAIPEPVVEENAVPVKQREDMLLHVHKQLADPTGIRDPLISDPALRPVQGSTLRQVVCVRFNPKDASGRYIGNVEIAAVYHKRHIASIITNPGALCTGVNYQPYPELAKLCKEINCPAPAGSAQ